MEEINLSDAAEISSGLTLARFKAKKISNAEEIKNYYHITLKSVEDNKIDLNLLEPLKANRGIEEHYLLKKGDIVIKLSPPYNAAMVDFNCENIVVPPNFAIIRSKGDFDPEYLAFVLNGSFVRLQLNRLVEGGALSIIKKSSLNQIRIRTRDMQEQVKYAKLLSLLSKRKELKLRIIELEDLLKENILLNI
ncbi:MULTISPECIES: hypothetical protein [Methanobacterium]|uniref:Restriction endonuclease subunit S n=1 Tax=Methanobacterium veterum TaxID=408577 RepID=A0A9E5A6U2_9EURY|nr:MULTISPECIES: hypothetical protein [Methanobacterium]MCZ3367266.1 hypothetical protein [Methanobacterium veterum]MCZ3373586.1 hypothetical protein [Methanobacterium veterum]